MFEEDVDLLVSDCEARDSRMSQWEQEFIADMRERIDNDHTITRPMYDKINQIWEKVTARG